MSYYSAKGIQQAVDANVDEEACRVQVLEVVSFVGQNIRFCQMFVFISYDNRALLVFFERKS